MGKGKSKNVFATILAVVFVGLATLSIVQTIKGIVEKNEEDIVQQPQVEYAALTDLGKVIEISESSGELTEEQVTSLQRGAVIAYEGEVYQLFQKSDTMTYAYTDSEGFYTRKYVMVTADGGYVQWTEQTTYALDSELGKVVSLTGWDGKITDEQMTSLKRGATLERYGWVYHLYDKSQNSWVYRSFDTTEERYHVREIRISLSTLTYEEEDYYQNYKPSNGLVSDQERLSPGETLTFEAHTMYIVQCYDSSFNTKKMKWVGGEKDGTVCNFAFIVVGAKDGDYVESLGTYTTGSTLNVTNLAGTAGHASGIKPESSDCYIMYYKIGGKVY